VAEINFDNIRLQTKGRDMQKNALKVMRQTRDSLPALVRYVENHLNYDNIKVFFTLTLLHRGVKGFGFTYRIYQKAGKIGGLLACRR